MTLSKVVENDTFYRWLMLIVTITGWVVLGWSELSNYRQQERFDKRYVMRDVYLEKMKAIDDKLNDIKKSVDGIQADYVREIRKVD